jgi:hypothetical protein
MGDVVLKHHLISQDAEVLLLARSFDIYGDISSVIPFYITNDINTLAAYDEASDTLYLVDRDGNYLTDESGERLIGEKFTKKVLFDKIPELHYVQKTFTDYLVENSSNYPYLVQITMTDMPRHLNLGDRLKLGETMYEVRLVEPISRLNDSIQKVMVCPVLFSDVPEVTQIDDPFIPEVNEIYKKSKVL